MSYTLSPYGVTFITTEESFAARAYDKDGHPTYGFGSTIRRDGSAVEMGDEISREDAVELFKWTITNVTDKLYNRVSWLTQFEVDALTSLLFNCGAGLLDKTHTLGVALAVDVPDGDPIAPWLKGVANAILLYDMATINGVRGPFLAARRKAEHDMFLGAAEVTTPSGTFKCAPSN
jgi:GH24 family phage-related lysozyme (muramidase)